MNNGAVWLKNLRKKINPVSVSDLIEEVALPVYHNFRPMLDKELSRVRRFEHPLSVAVFKPNFAAPDKRDYNGQKTVSQSAWNTPHNDLKPISELEFILCGMVIKNSIREIDIIVYDTESRQFIISFPETDITQAQHTIKRLKKLIGSRMASQLTFGLAEFPQNGLILEDLIEYAVNSCNS